MKPNLKYILFLIFLIIWGSLVSAKQKCDSIRYSNILLQKTDYDAEYSPDSSLLYCNSLLNCIQTGKSSVYLPFALYYKGIAYHKKEMFDSAITYFTKAKNFAEKYNHDSISANAKIQLGTIYDMLGYSDSAGYYYEQAIGYFNTHADTLGIVKSYLHLSSSLIEYAYYDKALLYGLKSMQLAKQQSNKHYYFLTLLNTGNVYEILKEYDKAIEFYELCFKESKLNSDYDPAARALTNIAVIHYRHKDYLKSESFFLEAIRFYKEIDNRKMQSRLLSNISLVYYKLGKKERANEALKTAYNIAEELALTYYMVSALINQGIFAKRNRDFTKAEIFYKKALKLAQKHGYRNETNKLYKNLSNLYEILGNFELAYYYALYNKGLSDSLYKEMDNKIDELKRKFQTEEFQAKILSLKNEKTKNELAKQKLQAQRNIYMGSLGALGLVLFLIIKLFRVKSKNNKIINEQHIRQLEDEKKLLAARSSLEGQENERQRIAHELHDGIGVLLSSASIHFSNLKEKSLDEDTANLASTANDFLKKASSEVRRISHNMMPEVLMKFGLCDALEDIFDEVSDSGNIEIEHTISGSDKRFPEKTEIAIYRIVQEMLNNTLKHANAGHIDFNFSISGKQLMLSYFDDGVGFDVNALNKKTSFGLSGIYSRVDYLNGKLKHDSSIGKGCKYKIEIPIPDKP